jgi:RNA polymerase sigma-70 factor (ECF subfamily)
MSEEVDEAIAERGAVLGLCYRLLGSLADAEDAVQEAYFRWYRLSASDREEIRSPKAWLMTTASRIALDMLGSARSRRERYVGEWLPEPVPQAGLWDSQGAGDRGLDPSDRVSLDESVSMAVLVVLESMTPAERVAFVLHDVFRYSFAEVGEIVGRSEEASRQLASTARRRVRESRRTPVGSAEHAAVVRSFKAAWETGDLEGLILLLDPSATVVADGGGVVQALPKPISGADRIAWTLARLLQIQPGILIEETVVNGETGLLLKLGDELLAVASFSVTDGRIDKIWTMRNPEKLTAW